MRGRGIKERKVKREERKEKRAWVAESARFAGSVGNGCSGEGVRHRKRLVSLCDMVRYIWGGE